LNTENIVITIDGSAGVGKSTVSQMLAEKLGFGFLDTGAMYRALTLAAMNEKADLNDIKQLLDLLERKDLQFSISGGVTKVSIDGVDVTDDIRDTEVTANVRYIAEKGELRSELVKMQRAFAQQHKRIVTEGRDQGTVAFADASFKFFLTADVRERAQRRKAQLAESGKDADLEKLQEQIEKRDESDMNRTVGPLTPAEDAIIIDTMNINAEQVVQKMAEYIKCKK
jgi:cytidylate kinase